MNPKVSIIVPIYNVEKYLRRCLDSLISQTYQNIEIILVNDGSKDNCLSICQEYEAKDERIIVIDKENGGVSSARNAGLKIFKGDYVSFIDSDDYVSPNYVAKLVNVYKENPNVDIVEMCQAEDKDGKIKLRAYQTKLEVNNHNLQTEKEFLLNISTNCCVKFYRRGLIEGRFFPEGIVYEDDYFIGTLFPQIRCYYKLLDEYDYFYVVREGSITHTFNDQIYDMFEVYKRLNNYYKNNNLFEAYQKVLEAKTARCLFVTTIGHRMAYYQGEKTKKQKYLEIKEYMKQEFPNWMNNPYLSSRDLKMATFVSQSYFNCQLLWLLIKVSGK